MPNALSQAKLLNTRGRKIWMDSIACKDHGKGFQRTPQAQTQIEGGSLKIEAGNPLFVWPIPNQEIVAPGSQIQPNESNR